MKPCIIFCAAGFDGLIAPIPEDALTIAADGGQGLLFRKASSAHGEAYFSRSRGNCARGNEDDLAAGILYIGENSNERFDSSYVQSACFGVGKSGGTYLYGYPFAVFQGIHDEKMLQITKN